MSVYIQDPNLVIIVPADVASKGARPSPDTELIIKLDNVFFQIWLPMILYNFSRPYDILYW